MTDTITEYYKLVAVTGFRVRVLTLCPQLVLERTEVGGRPELRQAHLVG